MSLPAVSDSSPDIASAIREELRQHHENAVALWEACASAEGHGARQMLAQITAQLVTEPQEPPEAYSPAENFTARLQEEFFIEILRFFELSDDFVAMAVERHVTNSAAQIELVTPFVTQIVNSANMLVALYTDVFNNERPITAGLQEACEKALSNIFVFFTPFLDGVEERLSSGDAFPDEAVLLQITNKRSNPYKEGLAEKYARRPQGTRQNRAKGIAAGLKPSTGRYLVEKAAEIARHAAQLSIELMEPGLVANFNKACPEGGQSSRIARKKAPVVPQSKPDKITELLDLMIDNPTGDDAN